MKITTLLGFLSFTINVSIPPTNSATRQELRPYPQTKEDSARSSSGKCLLVETSSNEGESVPKYLVVNREDGRKSLIELDTKSERNYPKGNPIISNCISNYIFRKLLQKNMVCENIMNYTV